MPWRMGLVERIRGGHATVDLADGAAPVSVR
jgi:hypothetical protein